MGNFNLIQSSYIHTPNIDVNSCNRKSLVNFVLKMSCNMYLSCWRRCECWIYIKFVEIRLLYWAIRANQSACGKWENKNIYLSNQPIYLISRFLWTFLLSTTYSRVNCNLHVQLWVKLCIIFQNLNCAIFTCTNIRKKCSLYGWAE